MPPLSQHEIWKTAIGGMVEILCIELDILMQPAGSTTFRKQSAEAGLEPDVCYYIQNAPAVKGKLDLDLAIDPCPDLAIEIDITRRSIPRQPIYADLGVPELWRFDGTRLSVLALTPSGRYEERTASLAFPFLPMDEFRRFLNLIRTADYTSSMRTFQKWVRTLNPSQAG